MHCLAHWDPLPKERNSIWWVFSSLVFTLKEEFKMQKTLFFPAHSVKKSAKALKCIGSCSEFLLPYQKGKDTFHKPLTLPCLITRKVPFPVTSNHLWKQIHTDITNPIKHQHSDLKCMPFSAWYWAWYLIQNRTIKCVARIREAQFGPVFCSREAYPEALSSQRERSQCMKVPLSKRSQRPSHRSKEGF